MHHKSPVITLILLLLLLFGCSDNSGTNPDSESEPLTSDYSHLSQQLHVAYQEGSQTLLASFFSGWQELLPPYPPTKMSEFSDTIRSAYQVFDEFYSPANLSRLTGGAHENFETEFRYIIVQNSLQIAVVDTNPRYYYYKGVQVNEITHTDFRPAVEISDYPVVFLSPEMDSVLYHFLFTADSANREDHQGRVSFLRHAVQLTPHHWFRDYHKMTMPYASSIILNDTLSRALVNFRVFYQFGDAYLKREHGNWTLIHSELTAIE